MSVGLYSHTTRATGSVLTAAIYNSDHQNHITNANPTMHGGYSDTVGQMQTLTDPGGAGSEVLAGSLAVELSQIRFALKRITGGAQWYTAPVTDLATIGGGTPLTLAFAATPLTLRRTENDTTEREALSIQSGSGVSTKYSRRIVGDGSNAVSQVRDYLGSNELWRQTTTLRTNQILHHFNNGWQVGVSGAPTIAANIAGFLDIDRITAPANPSGNFLRIYSRDVSGNIKLCYKDVAGTETIIQSTSIPAFVQGVRLGTVAQTVIGDGSIDLAAGNVVTGWVSLTGDPKNPGEGGFTHFRHKPVQQSISDIWATVSG